MIDSATKSQQLSIFSSLQVEFFIDYSNFMLIM
jgi:hypothetical protein